MFFKAAINGGRPRSAGALVPVTPEQIAIDANEAVRQGAGAVHAHPRRPDGEQTIEPDDVGAMVTAIRALDPGIVIGTTTGLWTCRDNAHRLDLLANWPEDARPDFASAAFSEEGAAETALLILELGMDLESAVWSMADIPALLASPTLRENIRILIEPEESDPVAALETCRTVAQRLRGEGLDIPLMYHGYDATFWPIVRLALEEGADTRVGFEDVLLMPDGSPALTNVDLIRGLQVVAAEQLALT